MTAAWPQVEGEKWKRKGGRWPAEEEAEFRRAMTAKYDAEASALYSSARLWDDGVIDPADTRRVVGLSLAAAMSNAPPTPSKFGVFRM